MLGDSTYSIIFILFCHYVSADIRLVYLEIQKSKNQKPKTKKPVFFESQESQKFFFSYYEK